MIILADLFSETTLNALVQLGAVGLLALAIVLLFRGGTNIINRFLDIQSRLTTAIEKIESSEGKQTVAIEDVIKTNREVVTSNQKAIDSNLEQKKAIIGAVELARVSIETSIKEIDSRPQLATIESKLNELLEVVRRAIADCNKGAIASE